MSPTALTSVAVKSLELRRDQEAKSGCVLGGVFGYLYNDLVLIFVYNCVELKKIICSKKIDLFG